MNDFLKQQRTFESVHTQPAGALMRPEVARRLVALDERFYEEHASSFAATRQAPWPGWRRCLADAAPSLEAELANASGPQILDVACGNLRLARFLAEDPRLQAAPLNYRGLDACPKMADLSGLPPAWDVSVRGHDLISGLFRAAHAPGRYASGRYELAATANADVDTPLRSGPTSAVDAPSDPALDAVPNAALPSALGSDFDLVCCFGFMHHVPGRFARRALIRQLVLACRPGGTVCVSFWCFLDDAGMAARARTTTADGLACLDLSPSDLEAGDCLLGWQGHPDAFRYCHAFDERQVGEFADAAQDIATVVDNFMSDGRTGALNAYLVLRRNKDA